MLISELIAILRNPISYCLFLSKSFDVFGVPFMVVHLLQNQVEKKLLFFEKIFVSLQNIRYLQKKMFLYGKRKFIEKNINENVKKNTFHFRNIILHRKCFCYIQNTNLS